jgi:predicted nucleic acid-binding protein
MSSLPAGLLLFDTGIYIRFSRGEDYRWLGEDDRVFQRTILTTVVAAELYAGTRDRREKQVLDELCRAHGALGHFSSPPALVWVDTGILVRRARSAFGQLDFARHFRDVLIALEAVRAGATLVTENVTDFARWKSLLASARRTLKLFNPAAATQGLL